MSSQRGNVKRKPQKHQNTFSFKNDMHDKSGKMQAVNSLTLAGLCQRCKEIIDWKIKYKKYKPLTVMKKCIKCQQKRIKQAYYTVCSPCIKELKVCGKCGHQEDELQQPDLSEAEKMSQERRCQAELEILPERKRRTFVRLQEQGKITDEHLREVDGNSEESYSEDDTGSDSEETEKSDLSSDVTKLTLKKSSEAD